MRLPGASPFLDSSRSRPPPFAEHERETVHPALKMTLPSSPGCTWTLPPKPAMGAHCAGRSNTSIVLIGFDICLILICRSVLCPFLLTEVV